jgi:type IV secretory pathway VirB4 component
MFNATTNIDWAFDGADVLAFDFSELEVGYLQTFYYSAAFGALYRHIHNPHRRPMRPVLAAIDEFRIMAQVPGLREFVASMMKHGRAFGGHLWVIDQDFHVLDGPDEASQSIITNTTFRAIFHQETRNAERVGETLDGIRPHHVRAITKPVRGQCVVSWKGSGAAARENQVVVGRVEPTAEEFAFFRRT